MSKGWNEDEKPRGSVRVSSEAGDLGEPALEGLEREEDEDVEEEGQYPLDSIASRFLEVWVRIVSQFHCDGKVS